ncbi:MAG: glycosyltransferase [Aequorivita sp.]
MNRVVFISYINFNASSAGAARVRMYQKMFDFNNTTYQLFSIEDYLNQSKSRFVKLLHVNKYIRYFSYPIRTLLYVLSLKQFIKPNDKVTFYLYPSTKPLLDYYFVYYLKLFKRQKIFCEINEVRRYGASIKEKSLEYYNYLFHERLSKKYDGLVCISTNIEAYYRKYNQNTIRVPIICDTDIDFIPNISFKKEEVFQIGFTGSVNIEKENLDIFFSALKKIKAKNYRFQLNLYGTVSNPLALNKLIKKYGLESHIVSHGFLKQSKIQNILTYQNLLILPRRENNQNKYGFSTKLSEYITSGVPILLTDVSDNMLYFTDQFDCLLAVAESDNSFVNKIEYLINNYEIIGEKMAYHAFETAKRNFDYKVHAEKFMIFLTKETTK